MQDPIIIYDRPDTIIPEGIDFCYLQTADGWMVYKKVGLIEAIVPARKPPPQLRTLTPKAEFAVGQIPLDDILPVFNFFRRVYQLYRAEAIVIPFLDTTRNRWNFIVPPQVVGPQKLSYIDNLSLFDHGLKVGTIHSHACLPAFHSGTDSQDEDFGDGLHMTFGNVDSDTPSVSVTLAVGGHRFLKNPRKHLDGIRPLATPGQTHTEENWQTNVSFELPPGKTLNDYPFPTQWLEQVNGGQAHARDSRGWRRRRRKQSGTALGPLLSGPKNRRPHHRHRRGPF